MNLESRLALVERFFSGTGDSYDFMVNATTFGGDRRWKRRIIEFIPTDAERVLDFACGTGISTLAIADRRPGCQVVGVELRDEYLDVARTKVRNRGIENVDLVLSRAEDYVSAQTVDCIVSFYLAKYADLPRLVANAHLMLKPGGVFLMQDFTYPSNSLLAALWRLHFKALQTVGSSIWPSWREIFFGLPELIEKTRWVEDLTEALEANGFSDIRKEVLTAYGSTLVLARK